MLRATSKTAVVALVACLAACSDGAVAPTSDAAPNVSGQGSLATLTRTDTVRFSIVVDPSVPSAFYLGAGNTVRFPTAAICDPATSTYGETEWDQPCSPSTTPVTINVSAWLDPLTGNPRVDFASHVRFVPSDDPSRWVTLAFTDESAALDSASDILYCTTAYADCITEANDDSTLTTVKNPVTGLVTRRIKHFSGYLLGSGDDCGGCQEGSMSFNRAPKQQKLPPRGPSVSMVTPTTSLRKISQASGYMFATGETFDGL